MADLQVIVTSPTASTTSIVQGGEQLALHIDHNTTFCSLGPTYKQLSAAEFALHKPLTIDGRGYTVAELRQQPTDEMERLRQLVLEELDANKQRLDIHVMEMIAIYNLFSVILIERKLAALEK